MSKFSSHPTYFLEDYIFLVSRSSLQGKVATLPEFSVSTISLSRKFGNTFAFNTVIHISKFPSHPTHLDGKNISSSFHEARYNVRSQLCEIFDLNVFSGFENIVTLLISTVCALSNQPDVMCIRNFDYKVKVATFAEFSVSTFASTLRCFAFLRLS